MKKQSPTILIIIVTWNKKRYVLDLLRSLTCMDYPKEDIGIVVVDNASEDGTMDAIAQEFQTVHLIRNSENLGGTGGFNTGLAWAFEQAAEKYNYLWLLDNDVVVHQRALTELVGILEKQPDIGIAGSTMMQLDFPFRINEMGAFVNRSNGTLVFNRHREIVRKWQDKPLADLLRHNEELSTLLDFCSPTIDVDYVAAASLLIRTSVARDAGLWKDYFIHFDDVEWCLRIAKMGHRIVASAHSLIWHLSAVAKVPTWVLYYDSRNILYLLREHSTPTAISNCIRYIYKRAIYYSLIGKHELANLHIQALDDFHNGVMGKKNIQLNETYQPSELAFDIFMNPNIRSILVPWSINLQASNLQISIVKAMKQRADLVVTYIVPPNISLGPLQQIPNANPLIVSKWRLIRWFNILCLGNRFDLVLQSDYKPIIALSWVGKYNLFVNYESICNRKRPRLAELGGILLDIFTRWINVGREARDNSSKKA